MTYFDIEPSLNDTAFTVPGNAKERMLVQSMET